MIEGVFWYTSTCILKTSKETEVFEGLKRQQKRRSLSGTDIHSGSQVHDRPADRSGCGMNGKRRNVMKGYVTAGGYMGYIDGRYILFASEAEYADYMSDEEEAA